MPSSGLPYFVAASFATSPSFMAGDFRAGPSIRSLWETDTKCPTPTLDRVAREESSAWAGTCRSGDWSAPRSRRRSGAEAGRAPARLRHTTRTPRPSVSRPRGSRSAAPPPRRWIRCTSQPRIRRTWTRPTPPPFMPLCVLITTAWRSMWAAPCVRASVHCALHSTAWEPRSWSAPTFARACPPALTNPPGETPAPPCSSATRAQAPSSPSTSAPVPPPTSSSTVGALPVTGDPRYGKSGTARRSTYRSGNRPGSPRSRHRRSRPPPWIA